MNPHYKLICLDLDGTLFTRKRTITARSREAIHAAEKIGAQTVIATGRPLFDAVIQGHGLHTSGYVIASSGAVTGNVFDGTNPDASTFTPAQVAQLLDLAEKYELQTTFFTSDDIYARGMKLSLMYRGFSMKSGSPLRGRIKSVSAMDKEHIQKANYFGLDGKKQNAVLEALRREGNFELVFAGRNSAEITAAGVTKGRAVMRLAERLGIEREEILAIGDSENDIEMIRYAGLGIAMENAILALKNVADRITLSNDRDGVAEAIERYVL